MIPDNFKPLLAATVDLAKVKFPCFVSPKLDGIRVLGINGKAMTRSMKEVPNHFVQSVFASGFYDGLDGEIIVGPPNAPDVYRVTNSAVMSKGGEPDFTYHVFDRWDVPSYRFEDRFTGLLELNLQRVSVVPHSRMSEAGLLEMEQFWLNKGYEGVMGRSIDGTYKYGRSTMKEGILWKLKRMSTSEAIIEGVVELERNLNEAKLNELGYTERSTAKDGMAGGGTMGSLLVRDIETSVLFSIGTGFTSDERDAIWVNRGSIVGKIITYNHFSIGNYDKPRFPSFKGFRDKRDL